MLMVLDPDSVFLVRIQSFLSGSGERVRKDPDYALWLQCEVFYIGIRILSCRGKNSYIRVTASRILVFNKCKGLQCGPPMCKGLQGGPSMSKGLQCEPSMCKGLQGGPSMCEGLQGGPSMCKGLQGGPSMCKGLQCGLPMSHSEHL